MEVTPIVRYMILCENWEADPMNPRRVNIYGLLSNVYSRDQPPYPLVGREICVFLALTEGDSGTMIKCLKSARFA